MTTEDELERRVQYLKSEQAREQAEQDLVGSLVGRTVTRAAYYDAAPAGREWCGHELCMLELDDGRIIEFGAYGYDAWGATISEVTDPADRAAAFPTPQP